MVRWFSVSAAALALVAAGIVHGYWTDRWVASTDTSAAAALLDRIPLQVGEWDGEEIEVKPGQVGPGVTGCIQRRYKNARLGVTVVLALVNGRPGPVATHTPEACYGASGYLVGQREAVRLDTTDPAAQFWTADAVRTKVTEETRLRLYWAWHGGQGWVSSNDARTEFPRYRHPVLHKLYVLRELTGNEAGPRTRDEPCESFLRALLPELDKALFSKGG
jgi:hypothetical protein